MTNETDKIAAAIAKATGEIGYIQKTGKNKNLRYTYASDEDLTRAIAPVLAANGLALVPVVESIARDMDGTRVTVTVRWIVAHESGQRLECVTASEGTDRQDKAVAKALTGARKYLLRLLFSVATGDDAERDDTPTPAPTRKAPAPAPAPEHRETLIQYATKAAGDDADQLDRWTRAIDAQPARLLPTLARRIADVQDVAAALNKLKGAS
jgi:hypothetical protein